jgi:hypothetical protein
LAGPDRIKWVKNERAIIDGSNHMKLTAIKLGSEPIPIIPAENRLNAGSTFYRFLNKS